MKEGYRCGKNQFRSYSEGMEKEWLLTNGIGGYANMSIHGGRSRVFSGYLVASFNPPADRKLLLSGVHEEIIKEKKQDNNESISYESISFVTQQYLDENREGYRYLNEFTLDPLPQYHYQAGGFELKKTICMVQSENTTVIHYRIKNGNEKTRLVLTPLFQFRDPGQSIGNSDLKMDIHLNPTNQLLRIDPSADPDKKIYFYSEAGYYVDRTERKTSMATPNYLYEENNVYAMDVRNGFQGVDSHRTPYDIVLDLEREEFKEFSLICSGISLGEKSIEEKDREIYEKMKNTKGRSLVTDEIHRIRKLMDKTGSDDVFYRRLSWAADAYITERRSTELKTILAGFPWFYDWGRDTMIALCGLTLATKRYDDAKEILVSFTRYIKDGMLPNVFPGNSQEEPQYNTIDASLWFFVSVYQYLNYTGDYDFVKEHIYPYLIEIFQSYRNGTRYGIKMDEDGLIMGGSDLDQLTWMDVRVGDLVVTPRHGKAVEINALWYNAVMILSELQERYEKSEPENESSIRSLQREEFTSLAEKIRAQFVLQFWNEGKACLYDTVKGTEKDEAVRPNQIFAVSLPFSILDKEKEKQIVTTVHEQLYTIYGIRSLSIDSEGFKKEYIGKLIDRDKAYHMGTTWAYLSGAFISAYCKVHEHSKEALEKAKEMCFYFQDHMEDGCLNQISEIFDGEFPNTGRGCFAQAWSVGEVLRAYKEDVLMF